MKWSLIIHKTWILSILIYFVYFRGLSFTIRLGATNLNSNDPNVIRLSTDNYFLHPDYDPTTLINDVGLIKLRIAITYNGKIFKKIFNNQSTQHNFLDYIKPVKYFGKYNTSRFCLRCHCWLGTNIRR
jgi:hypothetical protein